MDIKLIIQLFFYTICSYTLISCSSETSSPVTNNTSLDGGTVINPPSTTDNSLQKGYFLDSAVENLFYVRSDGINGKTDAEGSFEYYPGDVVEFRVGDIVLGSTQELPQPPTLAYIPSSVLPPSGLGTFPSAGSRVTPLTITPNAENKDNSEFINKLIFLQTLDDDGDPENGIKISDQIHTAANGINLNFSLPVEEFINGEFATWVTSLNDNHLFSTNIPRAIRSEIDALRHFGDLSYSFSSTTTYKAWWRETGECSDIGKSQLTIRKSSVSFCPNITGYDGCYEGVIRASGDILLPEMLSNSVCAQYSDAGINLDECNGANHTSILANLAYLDGTINGTYEASCNANINDKQVVTANFVKTEVEGTISFGQTDLQIYLTQLGSELDEIINSGSCITDSDCSVLILKGSFYCSLPLYKAYPTINTDIDSLLLKKHIYTEIKDEIEASQYSSGTTSCYIKPEPTTSCIQNSCQFEDGSTSTYGF